MNDEKKLTEIRKIKAKVEASLLTLPGVTGVDIGYKVTNGKKTRQLAIRVYVSKKKEVDPKERIPKQFQGIPTDVIERKYAMHTYSSGMSKKEE